MDPSILSSISGQFSKTLIMSTLLPAILFIVLCLFFVVPLLPYEWQILERLITLDSTAIVSVSFVTIILTGLLYSLNSTITRIYEGYTWSNTYLGQRRIKRYQAELQSARVFMDTSLVLRNELSDRDNYQYSAKISQKRIKLGQRIANEFPDRSAVLPTRLGNMIRSSESYPILQYNMAGVTLWSRLRAKIDKDYSAAIDDAKMPLDFSLNCSALSIILALLILICGLLYPIHLTSRRASVSWGLKTLFFIGLAFLFYRLAIAQAQDWGRMFRGAFDLYRWELLKQLGYKQLPTSMAEERALWGTISRQVIYGDPPGSRLVEQYGVSHAFAYGQLSGEPYMTDLPVTRGISQVDSSGRVTVTLGVKNADGQKRTIRKIVIRDTLPEGFDYLWGSAASAGQEVPVSGANPYYFETRDLAFDEKLFVVYTAIQRKKA